LDIVAHRLYNQQLERPRLHTPNEVVAWLGAVQAQDYAGAKWALGQRLKGVTDADIEQAFTEGKILRTHVMRPTWHFVTPEDIRWLLELTASRVNAVNGTMYRKLELDEALFLRTNDAIIKALQGGRHLTRTELAGVLEQAGIIAEGMRLGYIVHRAELDGIVCSGPRRGKQFTYMLLDERAPQARTLDHETALAELTRRFFTSHGPATVQDFAWWSGLTIADVKAGLAMAKPQLVEETINGKTYWLDSSVPTVDLGSPKAFLLPPYDEYAIAYRDHSAVLDLRYAEQAKNTIFNGVMVIDGQVLGNWKRTFTKGAVVIESAPFRPLTAAEQGALAAAVRRFGEFLDLPVILPAEWERLES